MFSQNKNVQSVHIIEVSLWTSNTSNDNGFTFVLKYNGVHE